MVLQAEATMTIRDATGDLLTPPALFERFYEPIDLMITANRYEEIRREREARSSIVRRVGEERSSMVSQPYNGIIEVTLSYDDKPTVTYRAHPRTNTHPTTKKRPNIVILEGEDGRVVAVLREARTYARDSAEFKGVSKTYKNGLNHELYPRGIVTQKRNLVPEPALVQALRKAGSASRQELGLDGTPIIPETTIVADNGNTLYYVRSFLTHLQDSPANPVEIGEFLGQVHSLGFIDAFDRQPEHYAYQQTERGRRVANFDPDFMLWTGNRAAADDDVGLFLKDVVVGGECEKGIYPTAKEEVLGKIKAARNAVVRENFGKRTVAMERILNEALAERYASVQV